MYAAFFFSIFKHEAHNMKRIIKTAWWCGCQLPDAPRAAM